MPKKRQEIEDLKRRIYKTQNTVNKLEGQSTKLRSQFDDLKVRAPYLIHPTQLLGKDKERNLYFVEHYLTISSSRMTQQESIAKSPRRTNLFQPNGQFTAPRLIWRLS